MCLRRHVIGNGQSLNVANPSQSDGTLPILRRLGRVWLLELARGTRNRSINLLDLSERFRFIELSGHQQDDVVGLVVLAPESLQAIDWNALDVCARADR